MGGFTRACEKGCSPGRYVHKIAMTCCGGNETQLATEQDKVPLDEDEFFFRTTIDEGYVAPPECPNASPPPPQDPISLVW